MATLKTSGKMPDKQKNKKPNDRSRGLARQRGGIRKARTT